MTKLTGLSLIKISTGPPCAKACPSDLKDRLTLTLGDRTSTLKLELFSPFLTLVPLSLLFLRVTSAPSLQPSSNNSTSRNTKCKTDFLPSNVLRETSSVLQNSCSTSTGTSWIPKTTFLMLLKTKMALSVLSLSSLINKISSFSETHSSEATTPSMI